MDWGAAGWATPRVAGLTWSPGQVGGDNVGGVTVEGSPCPVVAHRGSGVGMRRCLLDVSEGNSGVESGADLRLLARYGNLCRRDHGRRHKGWKIKKLGPGKYQWTSSLGHTYITGGYDPPG